MKIPKQVYISIPININNAKLKLKLYRFKKLLKDDILQPYTSQEDIKSNNDKTAGDNTDDIG